jgi:general secretion pathway protein C
MGTRLAVSDSRSPSLPDPPPGGGRVAHGTETPVLRRFRKGFWLVHLLTLTLCGFFAARAAGQYLGGKIAAAGAEPVGVRQSVTAPVAVAPTPEAGARDPQTIVARNIFCSTCAPVVASEPERAESPSGLPTRTSLPLRLLATVIDAEDGDDGFAALLDTSSGRTRVAGVGEKLALEARLTAVEERRILLENSGRKEFLPLEEAGAKGREESRPQPLAPAAGAQAMVRSVGQGRFEISRDALNQTLSNTAALATQARIMPAQLQGQPAGFMLNQIRPGSFYTQLGFQDGDIIQAVSGKQLRTPEDALQLMTVLRTAQHVTISFQRHSKSITHDYTITNR